MSNALKAPDSHKTFTMTEKIAALFFQILPKPGVECFCLVFCGESRHFIIAFGHCANLFVALRFSIGARAFARKIRYFLERFFFNWLIILSLFIIIKAALDFFRKKQQGALTETFLHWLRQKLFSHQLRMDVRQYEERGVGRYLLRFSGDLSSVQQFLSKGILQFSADVLLVVMGLGLLFWLDVWLGGLVLVTALLLGGFVFILNKIIGKIETQRRDQKSALLSFINLRLLNIASLKAFNKETPERNRFDRRAEKIQKLGFSYYRWAALLEALVPFAIYALLAVAFLCIYHWKQTGYEFSSDKIFAFVLILLTLRSTLSRTMRISLVWKKGIFLCKK